MTSKEIFPTDYLIYGPPHAGKTSLVTSAMWDWVEKKKIREGRLISIGREKNSFLHTPDEFTHTGSGESLYIKAPLLDTDVNDAEYDRWLKTLDQLTRSLIRDAKQGKADRPQVIGFDGWTEFDLLYENSAARQKMDTMQRFGSLLSQTFGLLERLDPEVLEIAFISTARVAERRKAKVNKRGEEFVPGDPDYIDVDYYPSYRGQMKFDMPHYFSNVFFMQEEVRKVKRGEYVGREMPVHALTVLRSDEAQHFLIKNQSEHEWLDAGYDTTLINPSFDDINDGFIRLKEEYGDKPVTKLIRHEDVV